MEPKESVKFEVTKGEHSCDPGGSPTVKAEFLQSRAQGILWEIGDKFCFR